MARTTRRERHRTGRRGGRSRRGSYLIALGVAAAIALPLIILLVTQASSGQDIGEIVLPSPQAGSLTGEGHFLGDSDAPVTLVDYEDFQCPFCREFALSALPLIEDEFVPAGELRVEARPIAFLGEESVLAAQAAECAGEQGRFWDYHDTLFANQTQEHDAGGFAPERLNGFAEALGMDTEAFGACLDSGRYAGAVNAATDAAADAGVDSVPRVLINGQPVAGTASAVRQAIQEELAAQP